ncbi:MAG TPA: maleylpyruvate isomerase family mycothiol-dependent enzyme [Streptosporangiaceae bacterium]|nr:maleylpyruvate isomerase family mycothiol-dependent enzyme [Streptosporangiaceae bacterium]
MNTSLDYVAHLATESARFGDAIASAPSEAPVPTCPDWTADDLLWHLGWVQSWWAMIVRQNLTGPEARELIPDRPIDRPGLLEFYRQAGRDLAEGLRKVPADTQAWTWSDDHTVRFIRRKQAHEALIHRVDAEVVAGDRTPMDPTLSADGVDEALRVMYSGVPGWGSFEPDPARTIRIHATDTGDSWVVRLGRFTGTDRDGVSYDEPDFDVLLADSGEPTVALFSGTAADLDCWLWHRPPYGEVSRSGDDRVLSAFEAVIAPGIG